MKKNVAITFLIALLISNPANAEGHAQGSSNEPVEKISPILVPLASTIFSSLLDIVRSRVNNSLNARTPGYVPTAEVVPLRQEIGTAIVNAITTFISGPPQQQLSVQNDQPNYQGLLLAVLVYDTQGKLLGERSMNEPFTTGERFKIKVQPTFTGLVEIENINPEGKHSHIYPESGYAVQVDAGQEAVIPMKENQFFEFTKTKGTEQLLVTVRDPRVSSAADTSSKAYREDIKSGSYYVQPVSKTTYPSITQSLQFTHKRQSDLNHLFDASL